MAQSLSASGLSPERSYELARIVERRLDERTGPDIAVAPDEGRDLVGFARQAESIATGVEAIVERACLERTPIVLEGIHLVPGALREELHDRCIAVEAVLSVEDEELHRSHFSMRG